MILAVDPGAKGAVAYAFDHSAPHGLLSLANHDVIQLFLRFQALKNLVPHDEKCVAFLEENTGFIAGHPRTGSSMWKFGRSTGLVEGILATLGFELRRVRPRAWQRSLGAPLKRAGEAHSAWKSRLATFARERCPSLNSRITRDNADAVLILLFGLKEIDNKPLLPDVPVEQPNTIIIDHDN